MLSSWNKVVTSIMIIVMSPSHSDKDHVDCTASWKLRWTRRERGKYGKQCSFQVHSTSLLRPCQVLAASKTFQLISYHARYQARTTSSAFLLHSYYDMTWYEFLDSRAPKGYRQLNLTTLLLGRLPKRLTSTKCTFYFASNWQLPYLNQW